MHLERHIITEKDATCCEPGCNRPAEYHLDPWTQKPTRVGWCKRCWEVAVSRVTREEQKPVSGGKR